MIRYILPLLIIFNFAGAQTNEHYLRLWADYNAHVSRVIAYYMPPDTIKDEIVIPSLEYHAYARGLPHDSIGPSPIPTTNQLVHTWGIINLLELYSRYEKWCADTVEKRGWDYWKTDTTRFRLDSAGNKLYYVMKQVPNYYRDRRLPPPNGLDAGFLEFLRKQR
jgi:hypothetical protein